MIAIARLSRLNLKDEQIFETLIEKIYPDIDNLQLHEKSLILNALNSLKYKVSKAFLLKINESLAKDLLERPNK